MDIDILRKSVDILNELIDEKIGSKKKVDPLDEWRALEPGRKVLSGSQNLYEIIKPWSGKELLGKQIYGDHPGFECPIYNLTAWQIIPLGPFDGSRLKVGDWVWVEGMRDDLRTNGWHQILKRSDSDHGWETVPQSFDPTWSWYIRDDGYIVSRARAHYYPPSLDETEEQRKERVYDELARDKAFVAHAIKVVSGELTEDNTCPNLHLKYVDWCNVALNGYPNHKTPCYKLYGNIQHCPCASIGQDKVKSDLIKIISKAVGV